MDKRVIGIFHSEELVIDEVKKLEREGYDSSDIYVVVKDAHTRTLLRGRTNIDVRTPEDSWLERFVGLLTGDQSIRGELSQLGLSKQEINQYFHDIDNGGILLYVNNDEDQAVDSSNLTNTLIDIANMTSMNEKLPAEDETDNGNKIVGATIEDTKDRNSEF